ncbi:hypothetical protein Shyhy01_23400 [Streptomyces hygroscopicus subsp. hygroscopicus]|nr:hypothetical protein Shyhy01_23400 [Streptomyces hygroscopicus subsp. hygroscopicus]
MLHILAAAGGVLPFWLLTVAAPALGRPRGDHPIPWRDPPPDVMGVPGNACPSPVMFFAVLQEGRWPPGPA